FGRAGWAGRRGLGCRAGPGAAPVVLLISDRRVVGGGAVGRESGVRVADLRRDRAVGGEPCLVFVAHAARLRQCFPGSRAREVLEDLVPMGQLGRAGAFLWWAGWDQQPVVEEPEPAIRGLFGEADLLMPAPG